MCILHWKPNMYKQAAVVLPKLRSIKLQSICWQEWLLFVSLKIPCELSLIYFLDQVEAEGAGLLPAWSCVLYRPQLVCKYKLSYGNWSSTGLNILAARWVDLECRFWRACLQSLTDVITSYQRGISCKGSTLHFTGLRRHHLAVHWQGAWPRSNTEKNPSAVSLLVW